MAIADQITRLRNAKNKFKTELVDKGLPSSNTDQLDVLIEKFPYIYTKAYFDTCMSAANLFNTNKQFKRFISMDEIQYDDTSKVRYFFQTFVGCDRVVPLNTSAGEIFLSMYWGSTAEEFPEMDTSNARSFFAIYSNCKKAKKVSRLNLQNNPSAWHVVYECNLLPKIEFINWNSVATEQSQMFFNCFSLKAVIIRSFGANKELNANNFDGCCHFKGTVDATYNPTGAKDGYIYVPRANVDQLKSATNWSVYATQIRALEDYIIPNTDGAIDLINGVFDDMKAGL